MSGQGDTAISKKVVIYYLWMHFLKIDMTSKFQQVPIFFSVSTVLFQIFHGDMVIYCMFDHIQQVYYRLHLYSFFVDLWAQLLIFQTLFSVVYLFKLL